MTTFVHPTAFVAPNVRLGEGSMVGDRACCVGTHPHAYEWLKDLPERPYVQKNEGATTS